MRNLLVILSLCLFILPAAVSAVPSADPGSAAARSLSGVAVVDVPSLDLESLFAADEIRRAAGLPLRFAMPHEVQMTPDRHGTWEQLDDKTLLWRLRVRAPGAVSVNLGFDRYSMPPGGQLFVYAADGSQRLAPFGDQDNETHGELWTPLIESDDLVMALTVPASEAGKVELRLAAINQGYREFGSAIGEKSGSCNVDVVCSEGDGWRDQIRSVARIIRSGAFLCTGFLVNNSALDQTPYFITADHCGFNSGNASTLLVYWNYENSTCRPPGSGSSGGAGDGSLAQTQSGSIFRASHSPSDVALLELDDPPAPEFNVYFAGWDRSPGDAASAVAIHHPQGDEKRISFEDDPVTTTSYLSSASPGNGTHIRVADWDLGTTEGGSSGSPLFSPEGLVTGQLHGGFAACGNNSDDWYGRMSVSWTGGGSSATRLSDWLDPMATGAMTLAGLDPFGGGDSIFTDGFESGNVAAWSDSMP